MTTTYKAQTILTQLLDLVSKEVYSTMPVVATNVDSDGNPYAVISATAAAGYGTKVVLIRVTPLSWGLQKDILGNTALQYTGHVIQIVTEANSTGVVGGTGPGAVVADILTPVELLPILIECGKTGCMVDWYTTPNATAPSLSGNTLTSATKQAGWKDLYWTLQKAV